MSEIWLVFTTELLRKLRSRLFWLATLGGVAAIAAIVETPAYFAGIARSNATDIILAGPPKLRAQVETLMAGHGAFYIVHQSDALPAVVTKKYLDDNGKAGAAIAISLRNGLLHVDVYPRDLSTYDNVEFRALIPLNVSLATGVGRSRIEAASHIDRTLHPVDAKFATSSSASFAHLTAFILVFVLYLAIIIASQGVMAAVAEEKTSRIAEILVATIEPTNLLAGKTFAAAIVAIVQLFTWMATGAVLIPSAAVNITAHAAATRGDLGQLATIGPGDIVLFLVFFATGYLQYATIYAAAASLISRTEDLAVVTTPVIMPVVGAFFLAQYALIDPNAPLVVSSSFIPFISPFVMFARISISTVPPWQIASAAAIDVITVFVCFIAAGRIYRVGMLLYGKLPSIRQIAAALRAN